MPGAAGESFGRSARRLAAHASRLSFLFFLFFSVSGEVRIHPGTCAFATCSAATSFTPPSSAGFAKAVFDVFDVFDARVLTTRTTSPRPRSHAPSAARLVFPFPSRHAYRSASGSVREPSVPPTQNAQSRGFVPGNPHSRTKNSRSSRSDAAGAGSEVVSNASSSEPARAASAWRLRGGRGYSPGDVLLVMAAHGLPQPLGERHPWLLDL